MLLTAGWLAGFCMTALAADRPLPTLRTAHQVQVLSNADAARSLPVHLARAQVSFWQPSSQTAFLLDETDAIRAKVTGANLDEIVPGDLISVDGCSGPGDAGALILDARIRKLGHAALPAAPLVSLDRLSSGAYDAHWVTVAGIIQSVARANDPNMHPGEVRLTLAIGQDSVQVSAPDSRSENPASLVDTEVRLRAVAENEFNQRGLLRATRLHMPALAFLQLLRPSIVDPFALPLTGIRDISLTGGGNPGHRLHTRGVITSTWGDQNFSIDEAGHGVFVSSEQPAPVHIGDLVDVVGFPSGGEYTVFLNHATLRRIGTGPLPPPRRLTAAQALASGADAEPIEVEGTLLQRSPGPEGILTLLLNDGTISFLVVLPHDNPGEIGADIAPGSRLRVSGIGVIHADGSHNPRELNVLLRSPADVLLLKAPPWWTLRHALILIAVLCATAIVILVWNGLLRRRVHAQTRQIRAQLQESSRLRAEAEAANQEKSKAMENLLAVQKDLLGAQEKLRFQATHDPLTGLWNRAALLESLHRELARTQRTGAPLGILLLDIDHFKQVNDTHGHLSGDAVLREIGRRLVHATRPYDTAGRYGGEEFLVILPGCGLEETEHSAERIRSAVASAPFRAGDTEFFLTVSIGATVACERPGSEQALLHEADVALYQAKSEGRNRTVLYATRSVPAEHLS
ncbi:MAG TPA: GGDEF domain-containing protein [Acidobacteriaceae bacterium]|nr:GGDEF domain-containing protein [Acidobacteriaceae bacterium]